MDKMIKSTLLGVLAVSVVTTTGVAVASHQNEKCYGIVKAGLNDCETTHTTCSGSSVKDKQWDAYILLPKGTCEKIVGGSLTRKKVK